MFSSPVNGEVSLDCNSPKNDVGYCMGHVTFISSSGRTTVFLAIPGSSAHLIHT